MHDIIQSISNIPISTILTISMIVLIFLSVLFGFLRGLKKSIFYTVFYLIGCIVFFVSLNSLTDLFINANISSLGIEVGGVQLKSLGESVPEVLRNLLSTNDADLNSMFVKGTQSYTLLMAILTFAVQFLLCIAYFISFQIVYKLIVWILWLIIGKSFIKSKRYSNGKIIKEKKQRALGGLVGLIPGFISVFMLFVPISGIFSIASSLTSSDKEGVSFGEYLSEEDYKLLKEAVGSYEESAPGLIFNISVSKDGQSLDVWAFDQMLNVNIDNRDFNIRQDLENIGKFANNIIATGLLDVVMEEDFTANELIEVVNKNEKLINSSFESLGDVELIDLIMNTGVEYLNSSRLVNESLELSTDSINYDELEKLDWSSEFKQMGNILTSAVNVLSVLPENEKAQPLSQLGSLSVATIDELDGNKTEGVLDKFIEELFKSNLVNEASTAGLEYIMGTEQVRNIVGDVSKEDLKDVDIKEDLLKISSALKSVIIISINNFVNVNLQELSNQSIELKNIIDELLELEVFKVVEDKVIDYTITNFIENNANIVKYVDIEELRQLKAADFKIELGAIVETFGRLGKETKIFNVEGLDNKQKLNYDAINSNVLRIINDNVKESKSIYKFLNQALEGAFVPILYENKELYQDSVKKFEGETEEETRENWTYEIDVFATLLESVEKEMKNDSKEFSLIKLATASQNSIKLGVLKGLSAKDPNSQEEYLLDESIFVREIMMKIMNKYAANNELFSGLFDDPTLEYGKELDTFVKIMVEGEIVENENSYEIQFATLEQQFHVLNEAKLDAFANHIEESRILQRIIRKNLKGQISDNLYNDMEDWHATPGRWTAELVALEDILLNGGFADENHEIHFNTFEGNVTDVSYPQLDVISKNIDNSLIIQDILMTSLTTETNSDGAVTTNQELYDIMNSDDFNWKIELMVIRDIVGSETFQYDNGQYSKMPIEELTNLNCIRPETFEIIADNINNSHVIKNFIKDPLVKILANNNTDEKHPNSWTAEEWTNELKSISYVSKYLAKPNEEKNLHGYPTDRTYIDLNMKFESSIKLEVLESLLGYSENSEDNIEALLRRLFNINPLRSKEINNDYGIHKSSVLRKLFIDAMNGSINTSDNDNVYIVNFDTYNPEDYYFEVEALYNAVYNAKLYDEKDGVNYIDFDILSEKMNNITPEIFENISMQVPYSKILQKQVQKTLHPTLDTEKTYDFTIEEMDNWGESLWILEMDSLNEIVQTLPTNELGKIDFTIGDKVRVDTIRAASNRSYSKIVRRSLRDTINGKLLVIEPINKDSNGYDIDSSKGKYNTPINCDDWNDYQWKYELNALVEVSENLREEENGYEVINTSNIAYKFNSEDGENVFDKAFLKKIVDLVYGEFEIGEKTIKLNSYILQAQLSPAIERLMNAGERIDESRIRFLHPKEIEGANWNEDLILPSYAECIPDNPDLTSYLDPNSSVGEWWSNEMTTMYLVVDDKYDDSNEKFNIRNINFNQTKISTLNIIKDNIDKSYVLQSALRNTIDGIMNQDKEYRPEDNPEKYSLYDYLTSEYWDCNQWIQEMTAIRDVAKTLSTKIGDPEFKRYVENSFKVRDEYQISSWVKDTENDSNYEFTLFGMNLEDNTTKVMSLDTLYFVSEYASVSNIIRSLLRPHIVDILNVNGDLIVDSEKPDILDDSFMSEWMKESKIDDGVNEYSNRWDYEMEALFNVAGQLEKDGYVELNTEILTKVPLSVISMINGAFTDTGLVDVNNISKDHGYVADYDDNRYQSEIIVSLLTGSLKNDGRVEPSKWLPEQWRYEIYAIEKVSQLIAEDGILDLNNIPFDGGIDINLISCLSEVINYSTYLQDKLDTSMFEVGEEESAPEAFPDINFDMNKNQWNGELMALYNVIKDNKTYVVDGKFNYDGLVFNENLSIDADILRNLGDNINQSTFLQYKLESTVEGLVPEAGEVYYVLDRVEYFEENFKNDNHFHVFDGEIDHICTIDGCGYIKDYHLKRIENENGSIEYKFDLEIKYNDPNYHAWSVELKTIFGIVLDDRSGMVNDNNQVVLSNIKDKLHSLSVDILTLTSDKLDEFGHDAYHSSNIIRLNLIRPLEEFAYNTNDESINIEKNAEAQMKVSNGFRWIDIPVDNPIEHNFKWELTNTGVYNITEGDLHRYNGVNSFVINDDNTLTVDFTGWRKSNNYIYELGETLKLDEDLSTENSKVFIKKGLDRDGNPHDIYKIVVNNDGTGIWYCIDQRSDLHELETFFKLIGANDLGTAKQKLTITDSNSAADILLLLTDAEIINEVNVLADESYLIGKTFENRGIDIKSYL